MWLIVFFLSQTPGQYHWVDKWSMLYSYWGQNQPSNPNGGCVVMEPTRGHWSDINCTALDIHPAVCKISSSMCFLDFYTFTSKLECAKSWKNYISLLSQRQILGEETFPKTLPRFVLILISLQRWQHRARKETKHFVSPHLIGTQLHQHDSASK